MGIIAKIRKRHVCPPDVQIRICINDEIIIGPVCGEELAYIAKFGYGLNEVDLLQTEFKDANTNVAFYVKYLPAKKR